MSRPTGAPSSNAATSYHRRIAATISLATALLAPSPSLPASSTPGRGWTDDGLVAAYADLAASGGLEAAVRHPVLPDHPPSRAFLEALAWFAAGTPDGAGSLSQPQLDAFLQNQVRAYLGLLGARVERGEVNDYARTRTWKVIQKLTLLRQEMSRPPRGGRYAYPAISRASAGEDPWEREHTLSSLEEFRQKVCRGSHARPVLVKFGNTNCTQCMLFEIIGSVKEFAENPAHRDSVDVYKVWWGLRPDVSFAAKIRDPERLDDLVKAEGVHSSPAFIVYRNGRRYPCGSAFPSRGTDEQLDACLGQEFGDAPMSTVCGDGPSSSLPSGR